jgi:hypothetical protein
MKMYQITEKDLMLLEEIVPSICQEAEPEDIAILKQVLSDVRWDYKPHSNTEKIDPPLE